MSFEVLLVLLLLLLSFPVSGMPAFEPPTEPPRPTTCAATEEGGITPPGFTCRFLPKGFPDSTLLISLLKISANAGLVSPVFSITASAVEDNRVVTLLFDGTAFMLLAIG